jgi:hypothetical protein
MEEDIPEDEIESALEEIEKFSGRGVPNEWREIEGFSELTVHRSGSIYRVRLGDYSFEYRTGRGQNFAETIGDMVGDDPSTLDEAARQNYGYVDQNLKAWDLKGITDESGLIPEELHGDFRKLYREITE